MAANLLKKLGELLGGAPAPQEDDDPPEPPGSPEEEILVRFIRAGNYAAMAKAVAAMPYKERRGHNAFFKKQVAKYRDRWTKEKARATALLGLLASSTRSEVKKRKGFAELSAMAGFGFDDKGIPIGRITTELIRDLKPDWADDLVDHTLGNSDWIHWEFAFELSRQGLCQPPTHPNFALLLPRELPGRQWERGKARSRWDPVKLVSEHRELLVPEIERMFSLPEADKTLSMWELGQADAPTSPIPYADLLLALVEREIIEGERLSRCCLGALSITGNKQLAKWYFTLFERLNPSDADQSRFATQGEVSILTLLGNANTAVHTWALKRLIALEKDDLVGGETLVGEIPTVIPNANKTGATAALRLLQAVGKKHESLRDQVALGVCETFLVEDKSLQERAIKILEGLEVDATDELASALTDFAGSIAPTLRDRFAALVEDSDQPTLLAFEDDTDITFDKLPEDPLEVESKIEPIRDLDELVEQIAHVWQNTDDPVQIERIVDGMTAMAGDHPPDFQERTAPLAQLMKSDAGGDSFLVLVSMQGLIRKWLKRTSFSLSDLGISTTKDGIIMPTKMPRPFQWFTEDPLFSNYLAAAGYWLGQKKPHPLLNLPTHTGGWIDPATLVERAITHARAGHGITEPEACIALLRLAPRGREAALGQLVNSGADTPFALLLRYALGDDGVLSDLPRHPPARIAAGRARFPEGQLPDELTRLKGPFAATPATLQILHAAPSVKHTTPSWMPKGKTLETKIPGHIVTKITPPYEGDAERHLPPALYHKPKSRWYDDGQDPCVVRWRASIWPANLDPILTRGIAVLAPRTETGRSSYAQDIARAYVETLQAKRHGPAGYTLCWAALNHAGASVRSAAVDTLAVNLALEDFNSARWAEALEPILGKHIAMLNRVVPGLAELAQMSPAHSLRITETLCAGLDLGDAKPPRLFGKLLEFLVEQRVRHPAVTLSEGSRRYLESLPKKGKVGTLAKKLLAS